jgi:hypothetical protein
LQEAVRDMGREVTRVKGLPGGPEFFKQFEGRVP